MAGTVMHLVIADKLLDKLNIKNPAYFYCGNLAPDAIMARKNYVREMKNHTHFKEGQKPYDFRIKKNQEDYLVRLNRFVEEFKNENDPYFEVYLGYVVHILVDELYLLEYYEKFVTELYENGMTPADKEFTRRYVEDVDLVDWELVRNYKFRFKMPDILKSVRGYEIPGWITGEEIEDSKYFIINKNFETEHEKRPLNVMDFEGNYEFIDLCVERIPRMLSERFGGGNGMSYEEQVKDIRTNWAIADAKRDEGLTTPDDIKRFDNISYGSYGDENLLDIYVKKSCNTLQPAIVNVHGGAWCYGCKEIYQYYCMSLAQKGFTVVNINYRLAPESNFPAPLEDINNVMKFIESRGAEFFIDKDRLIMTGDSAGGQLVSHYAAIWSDTSFAALFDFDIPKVTIKAVGLNCGIYDGRNTAENIADEMFMGYIGKVSENDRENMLRKVDTMSHITAAYPASFVMTSEADFLHDCAEPMYQAIKSAGAVACLKIYGSKDRPDIGHVFHVNIRLEEARDCNDDECEFFLSVLKN